MSDSTRRELLKRGAIALGAGLLLQPNGGVFGSEGQDKKDDTKKKKKGDKKGDDKKKEGDKDKKDAADKKKKKG